MKLRRLAASFTAVALPSLFALSTPSCSTEAYCFICEQSGGLVEDGGAGAAGVGGNTVIVVDGGGGSGGSINIDSGTLPEGGPSCTADIENDEQNCGMCGYTCSLLYAFPVCVAGVCEVDTCAEGYEDLNMIDSDGCEYMCPTFPPVAEVCNGEDDNCDGEIDEGFDLTTLDDCGGCGIACAFNNATALCQDTDPGSETTYQCVLGPCDDGFYDADTVQSSGCEYACTKTADVEICNNADDDCNGLVNDNVPPGAECTDMCPTAACEGLCEPGQFQCIGVSEVCFGGQGPEGEICDGEDNDCDGVEDNGFDTDTDILNCGMCGNICNLPNAIEECFNGGCRVAQCLPGYADLTSAPGCEHMCAQYPTSPEVCDGEDNNCDGIVDKVSATVNLTPPANFCKQTGPCAGSAASCVSGAWRCNYQDINPDIEVNPTTGAVVFEETRCDDFDGDCDNQVDESFVLKNTECSDGEGRCADIGEYICNAAGTGTECDAVQDSLASVDELCNGIDDNCDGQVDERVPAMTLTCQNGGVHTCLGMRPAMIQTGSVWMFQYEASRPDAETTDVDNSRACSKVGVTPWVSVSLVAASNACAALRNVNNQPMRLCDEVEWQTACLSGNGVPPAGPFFSYSAADSTYVSGVCNDRSIYPDPEQVANLPRAWATGFDAGLAKECHTTGAGGFFDMSGNVAEWTSTEVTEFGTNYNRVKGGSFLTYGTTTACGHAFVLSKGDDGDGNEGNDFRAPDLGFRCCSSAAPF